MSAEHATGDLQRPLREILVDSYIAAVAVALLLLWSLSGVLRFLWPPVSRAVAFLFTAIAILDLPYFSPKLTTVDRLMLITMGSHFYCAITSFLAACLLSRWAYGVGPFRCLTNYGSKLIGGKHA